MEMKTVGIVGAGVSGLLACKYALQKGFRPLVFEANTGVGGAWFRTLGTTKLQTPRPLYRFIDFPWPAEVREEYPESSKVKAYIESYARHFDLLRHIRFRSRVVSIEYVGVAEEEVQSWSLWAGTGEAFGGRGRWQLTVDQLDEGNARFKTYEVDFVILCIGRFSGLPNMPSFPPKGGPEVFGGKLLHSMDYSDLHPSAAADLVRMKRTVVVGCSKSAIDIAAECSDANGTSNPCTLVYRSVRWILPNFSAWGVPLAFFYLTRLAELLVRKPGQGFAHSILATMLSPLGWLRTKFVESYLKWKMPLHKYGLEPEDRSITQDFAASSIAIAPERFCQRIEEGSIVPKKSKSFSFYEEGIVVDDGQRVPADVVIMATGFKGDEKIRNMFASPQLQKTVMGSTSIALPLYRDSIHPRIPQLAIIGYCESLTNLYTSEMRCIWLMHFLEGRFRLPAIRRMEEEVLQWQEYMEHYSRGKSSIGTLHHWYNDRLCEDIGYDPTRKRGLLLRWAVPYLPEDFRELVA